MGLGPRRKLGRKAADLTVTDRHATWRTRDRLLARPCGLWLPAWVGEPTASKSSHTEIQLGRQDRAWKNDVGGERVRPSAGDPLTGLGRACAHEIAQRGGSGQRAAQGGQCRIVA